MSNILDQKAIPLHNPAVSAASSIAGSLVPKLRLTPIRVSLLLVSLWAVPAQGQTVLPFVDPPKPVVQRNVTSLTQSHLTTLPVALSLDLNQLMAQYKGGLPAGIDADGAWGVIANDFAGNVALKYKVWHDDPIITVSGNTVTLHLHLFYHMAIAQRLRNGIIGGGYSWHQVLSCGYNEPPREADVTLSYSLSWQNDYRLSANWHWELTHTKPCSLTVFNFDISGRINNEIKPQLDSAAHHLSDYIQGLDFSPSIQHIWNLLRSPLKSTDGNWTLLINPEGVQVSPINATASNLSTYAMLLAYPVVFQKSDQAPPQTRDDFMAASPKVPPLQVTNIAPDPHFRLHLIARLPFSAATQDAKRRLDGQTESWAGLQATIEVEEVGGAINIGYVKLKLTGGLLGKVYLVGTMNYDTTTDEFFLNNLHLTPEEATAFTTDIINHLNDPDTLASIAEKLRWKLGGQIQQVKSAVNTIITEAVLPDGFKLSGSLTDLHPLSITARPDCSAPGEPCIDSNDGAAFFINVEGTGTLSVAKP